jgi:hypothetical protein
MAASINTKDIDKVLRLFRQLSKLTTSDRPGKNKELWEQSLEQAKKEYIEEIKEHEKLLPPRTPLRKANKEKEEEFQKAFQHNTTKIAEKKYRQMDLNYDKACSQIEEKREKIVKDIDHFLYSIKEPLLTFDRVNGTPLKADWKEIRGFLIDDDFTHPNFKYSVQEAIDALEAIRAKIQRQEKIEEEKPAETEQKGKGSKIMITARTSKENWEAIRNEYDISKKDFGKKINFVSDSFKRKIIFRDVEHAFVLASQGFPKPSLILAGGVIEELLRLYLEHKNIPVTSKNFVDYIKTCEQKGLLKSGISKLSDSVREFRNLVHLSREETNRHTISKATAKGAVSSIFTIANDFQ